MRRFFNITGPCDGARHYLIPPERRVPDLDLLIEQQLYFVLHAARQTGKTTAMRAFAERLRAQGLTALHISLETSQGAVEVEEAEARWLSALSRYAESDLGPELRPPLPASVNDVAVGERLTAALTRWARAVAPRPVVLLVDEADVVSGPALVSMLRQLRAGFHMRPRSFPASVALIGMRDLRDYLTQAKDGAPVNPGSPFNIKAASITLRNFTRDEVAELYQQHTDDTGQRFTQEAVDRVFFWTQGQPFLVNALARIAVMELVPDPGQEVGLTAIEAAKDRLILARTTHLDALAQRLKDPRVARIVQPVLLSDSPMSIEYGHDDFQYVVDLGLVVRGRDGAEIANPLYREVLARQLSYQVQESLPRPTWRWQRPDGGLDMAALVAEFLSWWRENAGILEHYSDKGYIEAVPHLAFMGFLQRVINGGGTVSREFSANRGRVDLLVSYGQDRFVIELKRVPPQWRTLERVREEGVRQLSGYLDSLGEEEGWLIIFDQREGTSWEQRLWTEEREVDGKRLHLRGA